MTIRYVQRIGHEVVSGVVEHVVNGHWLIEGETFYDRKITDHGEYLAVGDQRIYKAGQPKKRK